MMESKKESNLHYFDQLISRSFIIIKQSTFEKNTVDLFCKHLRGFSFHAIFYNISSYKLFTLDEAFAFDDQSEYRDTFFFKDNNFFYASLESKYGYPLFMFKILGFSHIEIRTPHSTTQVHYKRDIPENTLYHRIPDHYIKSPNLEQELEYLYTTGQYGKICYFPAGGIAINNANLTTITWFPIVFLIEEQELFGDKAVTDREKVLHALNYFKYELESNRKQSAVSVFESIISSHRHLVDTILQQMQSTSSLQILNAHDSELSSLLQKIVDIFGFEDHAVIGLLVFFLHLDTDNIVELYDLDPTFMKNLKFRAQYVDRFVFVLLWLLFGFHVHDINERDLEKREVLDTVRAIINRIFTHYIDIHVDVVLTKQGRELMRSLKEDLNLDQFDGSAKMGWELSINIQIHDFFDIEHTTYLTHVYESFIIRNNSKLIEKYNSALNTFRSIIES